MAGYSSPAFREGVRERVVFGGPVAMTAEADLIEAQARVRRGEMGRLEPSF
ncbi:MAG: hypothetical protein KBF88_02980 [Polyangiaceae bacterium]|nr:hypothetical protein [Polyangiaceae bacterium]